jgi:hypothetical protein
MKEYIVTLKNFDDLNNFYEDMETPGGSITIPDRKVECAMRRDISRNTHYMLTEEEADQVRNDDRVLAVELIPSELGLEVTPFWSQTAVFQKASNFSFSEKQWGLLRCVETSQRSGWGTDSTTSQAATVRTTGSGKHVDVVIVDAHINPNHPEFAVNSNGSGGSRVNQIDWFEYGQYAGYAYTTAYDYSDISSNHGTHVAGTVAGNTQGWARNSTIYNMEFGYTGGGAPAGSWELYLFDYLRAWHKNKPINPATGRRNPTITNHSWGYSYNNVFLSQITSVTYRGTTTSLSGLATSIVVQTLESNGVPVPAQGQSTPYLYRIPARYAALDADIQDAINDGVIVISSAGNSYWNCDISSGQDYNNYIQTNNYGAIYHSRGSSPSAADGVICIGSIGTFSNETKSDFSNWGKRIDVWAPGSNIISSVYDSTAASEFGITLRDDPRNATYKLGSISGTSMASPQVSGLLACIMESSQGMQQGDARNLLIQTSQKNKLGEFPNSSVSPNVSPYRTLGGSNNRYLYYNPLRKFVGEVYPRKNDGNRPTQQGQRFPRTKIKYSKPA